jgi:molecular chaperone DnaK (HSP70)
MTSAHEKVNKVILAGGSSKIPLFLYLLNQTLPGVQFIDSDAEFIQRGLTCVQSDKIKVL